MQQGIDVKVFLLDEAENKIVEMDSPNGAHGMEKFEYMPTESKTYYIRIQRLDEAGNPDIGKITLLIRKFTKAEIQEKEKIKKELESENKKIVQTADIDHFWEAFDSLKNCKTRKDSIQKIQTIYLDRATDGLLDFIEARQFTAEKFINQITRLPRFFSSIRPNTLQVKKAAPQVEEIVSKFKEIYPNFAEKKICFAIGIVNTGGTVSDNFLLIGTEVSTSTKYTDLSEFNNSAFSKVLATGEDIIQKIKNIVAHEYVHTQQKVPLSKEAINCSLLNRCMKEGFCDFIGELTASSQINSLAQTYGDQHEKELWQEFKNELCTTSTNNWLYNYSTVKDRPADLGYYIGYKIAQEYYANMADKKQAVIDIIEMNDPIEFLQKSKYDQKVKK